LTTIHDEIAHTKHYGLARLTTATLIAQLALAGHTVHKGHFGDFTVCKYGLIRYCQDYAELQTFAKELGVK
jgi:hypothetical protein